MDITDLILDVAPGWLLWAAAAVYEVWLIVHAVRWRTEQPFLSGWIRPIALPIAVVGVTLEHDGVFAAGLVAFCLGAIADGYFRGPTSDELPPPEENFGSRRARKAAGYGGRTRWPMMRKREGRQ